MKKTMKSWSLFPCMLLLICLADYRHAKADFAQDKKECQDKLVGLSSCLDFMSGEKKEPSSVCCLKFSQTYNESRRCLCILVRDRNDPNLGFKVNSTLALTLPLGCHVRANYTECLDLLKLDPRSADAQIFEQFANSTINGTTTTDGTDSSSSTRRHGRKRLHFQMVGGVSIWILLLSFFNGF